VNPDGGPYQKKKHPHISEPNWETSFQGPLPKVAEALSPDGTSSPQWIRKRESDGKTTSIKRVKCHPGEDPGEVANIKDEEGQAKDRNLRNTASDSERAASSTTEKDLSNRKVRAKQDGRPRTSSL